MNSGGRLYPVMNDTLEMSGITKRFSGVTALESVRFTATAGEVVALIGENGAGKSTLMKILAGIHQPDAGAINFLGKPLVVRSPREAVHSGIAIIHQELELIDSLDIAGNIFLGRERSWGGRVRFLDRKKMAADSQVYLDRLGVTSSPETPVASLSMAQRQLVEIAKALSCDARVLIMDEPTSSLTFREADNLLRIVRELSREGVAAIYISHRLQEIAQVADRVVALRDGRNAGDLDGKEISADRMIQLMVGRKLAEFYSASDPSGDARKTVRLAVKDLRTERYPRHAISLDVFGGEILGIAGLVGAGRTELMRALFGIDAARSGSLMLDGSTISIDGPRAAIAHGIYLVPEDRRASGIIGEMSIRENITLASLERHASHGWVRRASETAAARQACDELKIRVASIESAASSLSGGNQQKTVLARWLSLGPKVMLFDEPTRGIDIAARSEVYQILRALARQGVAILLVSSDLEEVLGVCDRVAVMHEGKLTGILHRSECSPEAIMRLAVA